MIRFNGVLYTAAHPSGKADVKKRYLQHKAKAEKQLKSFLRDLARSGSKVRPGKIKPVRALDTGEILAVQVRIEPPKGPVKYEQGYVNYEKLQYNTSKEDRLLLKKLAKKNGLRYDYDAYGLIIEYMIPENATWRPGRGLEEGL